MTRSRAIGNVPNALMATYYGQRASAGLIVTEGVAPSPGETIRAGAHEIGTMGSSTTGIGLAMLRLDRVEEAQTRGEPIACDGVTLKVVLA